MRKQEKPERLRLRTTAEIKNAVRLGASLNDTNMTGFIEMLVCDWMEKKLVEDNHDKTQNEVAGNC